MTWQIIPVLVLVVFVTNDYAAAAGRLCGDRLAATLSLVCQGYYWDIDKRSGKSGVVGQHQLLRTRRSIVQECCHRTCSISELESYCAPSVTGQRSSGILSSLRQLRPGSSSDTDTKPSSSSSSSSSSGAEAAAAAAASKQKFTQGIWLNKPFFFVTPRHTGALLEAADRK